MKQTKEQLEKAKITFAQLESLVSLRQSNEQGEPNNLMYQKHPTDLTFPNANGWCLLQLAVRVGDFAKVKALIENNHVNVSHQMPANHATALFTALIYEQFEIAEYLQQMGACTSECQRAVLDCTESIDFFDRHATVLIQQAKDSGIFLTEKIKTTEVSYLDIAAQIGDISTIETFFLSIRNENDTVASNTRLKEVCKVQNCLLMHHAVENNQINVIDFLLQSEFPLDLIDSSHRTILHVAAKFGRKQILLKLLNAGIKINEQDKDGWTALYTAASCGHADCVELLIQNNADIKIKTYLNETILHAGAIGNINLSSLIAEGDFANLKTIKTYYGESAEDYAVDKDRIRINQMLIIKKIFYYLLLNYRDSDLLSLDGYCNALVFLYHFFDSRKELKVFFDIKKATVTWDGTPESLEKLFAEPLADCPNLAAVLEMFLYFITHFQAERLPKEWQLTQDNRVEQLKLISTQSLIRMFKQLVGILNREQLNELLNIFLKLPKHYRIEITGGSHATAINREQQEHSYYDPNFDKELPNTYTSQNLTELIVNTKYKSIVARSNFFEASEAYNVNLRGYIFTKEAEGQPIFNFFSQEELPTSQEEALAFIQKSPNGFSHLHIALLTRSKENILQLLDTDLFDFHQSSKFLNTSLLELAYDYGDEEILTAFLNHKNLTLNNPEILIKIYRNKDLQFLNLMIKHPKSECLHSLFKEAIHAHDVSLIKFLIANDKIQKTTTVDLALEIIMDYKFDIQFKEFIIQQYCKEINFVHRFCDEHADFLPYESEDSDIKKCFYKMLDTILTQSISGQLGYKILNSISQFIVDIKEKYAFLIIDKIENVDELCGNSIFKFTLLQYFINKKDFLIAGLLLNKMQNNIDHQHGENKQTALHYALSIKVNPEKEKEKKLLNSIIILLVEKGANVYIPNAKGLSCHDIIIQDDERKKLLHHHLSEKPRITR